LITENAVTSHHELHDDAAHLSDDLRQNIAFAVIGPASNCRD
jgi:hypothetical protein